MSFDDDLSFDWVDPTTNDTGMSLADTYNKILSNFPTLTTPEVDYLVTHGTLSDRPYLTTTTGETGRFKDGVWQSFTPDTNSSDWFSRLLSGIKDVAGKATTPGTGANAGLLALLGALAGAADKRAPSGGGVAKAYAGVANPRQRAVVQGKYGPIAKYAAQGGLMSAYARGGEIAMEDGGFVMTKKAVDGAGGIGGLKQHVPEAQHIRGPGTGTSDSIPARIQGQDGTVAPARVSNGEAYIPPGRNTQSLYALMRALERKA